MQPLKPGEWVTHAVAALFSPVVISYLWKLSLEDGGGHCCGASVTPPSWARPERCHGSCWCCWTYRSAEAAVISSSRQIFLLFSYPCVCTCLPLTLSLCGACVWAGQEVQQAGSERYSGLRWLGSSYSSWDRPDLWSRRVPAPGDSAGPPAHTHADTCWVQERSCTVTVAAQDRREVKTDEVTQWHSVMSLCLIPLLLHTHTHTHTHKMRRSLIHTEEEINK